MSPARRHPLRGQILRLGEVPIETTHGRFRVLIGRNLATGAAALAVHCGDLSSDEPLLARIHSSCVTSETFGGCDCDCVEQVDAALARIASRGRGVLFYLMQEGRGAGFAAKARDRMLVQASRNRLTTFEAYARLGLSHDARRYEEVGDLCGLLEVRAPLLLLTSNPDKLAALRRESGVAIADAEPLAPSPSPWNSHYIAAKSRSWHRRAEAGAIVPAELPEPVEAFEPYALPDDARFIHLATYLLPIRDRATRADGRPDPPSWFRLHAYADLVSHLERVVLTCGADDESPVLVRIQRESLLERFPLARDEASETPWRRAVRGMVEHGAGCATFLPSIGFDGGLKERTAALEPGIALLAHHLRGRAARILVAEEDGRTRCETEAAAHAEELLAASGVSVLGRGSLDGRAAIAAGRHAGGRASAAGDPESER